MSGCEGTAVGAAETGEPFSVLVLAGGKGRRMGVDKAALVLDGRTLLDRSLDTACDLSDDVLVVHRRDQVVDVRRPGVRQVADHAPYAGVMAGIHAGIDAANHSWTLVLACDMPFVSIPLVRRMSTMRAGYDAVVPRLPVGLEPLHAFYHSRCLTALTRALAEGRRRVNSFYVDLDVCYLDESLIDRIDPEHWSFFNINTAEDLATARERLSG